MGLWARTGRFSKAMVLIIAGVAGGGAAIAVASVPDSSGVIHACYSADGSGNPITTSGPNLTVIDPNAGQSCATNSVGRPGQRTLDWNVQGPPGATGQPGSPGSQGPPGPQGSPGASNTATVLKPGTLQLGGQVLTVESAGGGVTLPTPPTNGAGGSQAVLGSGRGAVSFAIKGLALLAYQTGAQSTGAGAGKAAVHDISITKTIDKASPKLAYYCASGKHFANVTITLRKKGGAQYVRYVLSQVAIFAVQMFSGNGNGIPQEEITFDYGSLNIDYAAPSRHGVSQVKAKVHLP